MQERILWKNVLQGETKEKAEKTRKKFLTKEAGFAMIAKRLRDGSPDGSAGTSESWFWMREQNGTKKFLKKVLDRAKKKC